MVFARIFLLPLFMAHAFGSEEARMGLDDAKSYAIQHNFEVQSLRQALDEAKARQGRSRSSFLPSLGIAGGIDTQRSAFGTQNSALGYAYANYNLFNGFEDSYRSEKVQLDAAKAEIRVRRTEFRVGLEVERAFYLYLYKKITRKLKTEAITLNEAHKSMAAVKKRSGLASDSDLMEFDLKGATLKSDLLLLEQELEEARNNFKKLLGEEAGSLIEPVGNIQHEHLKESLSDLVKRIKDESEPVALAAKDLAIAQYEQKSIRAKWFPKVDFELAAGYLPWDLRQVPAGAAMVGGKIVAKLDLFSGFETLYERREAEAKQLRIESELKQAILTSMIDMQNAYRKIGTLQARVDLEEENEARSKKYYASVLSEYRRGIKNSADLRVAADGVFDTGLKRESFKFDFINTRIELERALGGKVATELIQEHGKES